MVTAQWPGQGGLRTGRAGCEEVLGAVSFRRFSLFHPSKCAFSDGSFPT